MSRRHMPHQHHDNLGTPTRYKEIAICPGCDKVVWCDVIYGRAWWKPMLWPRSAWWRKRLVA